MAIITLFENQSSTKFRYGVVFLSVDIKELDNVHKWVTTQMSNSNEMFSCNGAYEICFKHQRDRDWFLLTWQ